MYLADAFIQSDFQGMAWYEKGEIIYWDKKIKKNKKNNTVFYHYKVVVYTHCQHTFQFKQLVKVHVASDEPCNSLCDLALDLIIFLFFFAGSQKYQTCAQ